VTRRGLLAGLFSFALTGMMLLSTPVASARVSATDLVRRTTDELLAEFDRNRQLYESDKTALYAMVERIAIPHFDFDRMTRLVLGRHARTASARDLAAFTNEFKTLLIRTYATALFQYTGQKIEYQPQVDEKKYTVVPVKIQLERSEPVVLEYFLAPPDGVLKVFDVSIDGISLVTNYRSAYNTVIRSKGLQALIDDLAARNRQRAQ